MAQQLSEVEVLIEELETRVERLRALYEMYFMGIEKTEPAVPRKDVDRRLYVLRRTQLRNTALRFRFQNVLLRYNTYQTYWMRIARKIEEGTYKRDVRRANARFASPARPKGEKATELDDDDLMEVHDTEPPPAPGSAPAGTSREPKEETLEFDVDVDEDDSPAAGPGWLEELQMRALLRPAPVPRDVRPGVPPPATPEGGRGSREENAPAHGEGREPMQTQPEIWIGKAPAKPASARTPSRPPPKARTSSPPSARAGARYAQGPQGRRPSERPAPGRAPVPATVGPQGPNPPPRKKSRPSIPKVEASRAPVALPRPAPKAEPAPPVKQARDPSLSEERVRQIYAQYVETKRSLKESTASLTYENLARSLRDSSDKLRSKHTGKSVDFEVAVKDGKTILRPVVK